MPQQVVARINHGHTAVIKCRQVGVSFMAYSSGRVNGTTGTNDTMPLRKPQQLPRHRVSEGTIFKERS